MSDENAAETPVPAKPRRQPIALEADVRQVCNDLVTGDLTLGEGQSLTPHAISVILGERRGGKEHRPSSGAVQEALKHWVEIGYITATQKPFAFADYTEDGKTLGLDALKARHSERKKAARAAQKAAAAPAPAEVIQGSIEDVAPEPSVTNGETASEPEYAGGTFQGDFTENTGTLTSNAPPF